MARSEGLQEGWVFASLTFTLLHLIPHVPIVSTLTRARTYDNYQLFGLDYMETFLKYHIQVKNK